MLLPGKSPCSNSLPSTINLNGCSISDKQRIINEFNFFSQKQVKIRLITSDDNDPNNFKLFLANKVDSSIFMESPRVNEMFNLINSLSLHNSVEHDNIPPYFLKVTSNIIVPGLCCFF